MLISRRRAAGGAGYVVSIGRSQPGDFSLLVRIVRQTARYPHEADSELVDRLTEICVVALGNDAEKRPLIRKEVTDACGFYHRRTEFDHFRDMESALASKKRSGNSGGFQRRKESSAEREVRLDGMIMAPPQPDPLLNPPTFVSTHTQYSGDLTISMAALVAPPAPTLTTWPTTVWNITLIELPLHSTKTTGRQRLDPKRLATWQRTERRAFDSQNAVMGGKSAQQAAAAGGIIPNEFDKVAPANYGNSAWEWLHLVSFKMGGISNAPQQPGNLVAGTYECNSLMISIEEAIKDLVLIDQLTLEVEVTATCIEGTHIGRQIEYCVFYRPADATQGEIRFRQEFNPLQHINPSRGDKDLFRHAMRTKFGLPV